MSTAMKPTAPPVGRICEDGLSTEELRALLEVEGADVSVGTAEDIREYLYKRIETSTDRESRR